MKRFPRLPLPPTGSAATPMKLPRIWLSEEASRVTPSALPPMTLPAPGPRPQTTLPVDPLISVTPAVSFPRPSPLFLPVRSVPMKLPVT